MTVQEAAYCTVCGTWKSKLNCAACGAGPDGAAGDLESLARRSNWGAFFLSGFWTFWHGHPWSGAAWWIFVGAALAAPLFGYSAATGVILAFALSAFLLVRGNRIALGRRHFRDIGEFVRVERCWARSGFGVFVVGVAAIGAVAVYALGIIP